MYILIKDIISIIPQKTSNGNYTEINLINEETIFVSKYFTLELAYVKVDVPNLYSKDIEDIKIESVNQVPTEFQALVINEK